VEVSLILTTYNWPQALKLTLQSVLAQSRLPDEVIVADDGSGPETAAVVTEAMSHSCLRWRHVWHPDEGIRQARVKNLGVRYSHGQYLVFIDHDVLLHPHFVADHVSSAERGCFLQGKRCFLPKSSTEKLIRIGLTHPPSVFARGLGNRKNAVRIPWAGMMLPRTKGFQKTLRGCNLSMHRDDFMRVDGFDETFDQLWGREDSDICYRMFHSGMRVRNLWFSALQYHLHHQTAKGRQEDRLDLELRKILNEKRRFALLGLSKLTSEGGVIASSHA
jgi:glycosyltransferase involved in cell wall biosynthesis